MYYFIPAWYGQTDEFWKTVIDPWYRIRQKIEFDDSLHQVRICQDEYFFLHFFFFSPHTPSSLLLSLFPS